MNEENTEVQSSGKYMKKKIIVIASYVVVGVIFSWLTSVRIDGGFSVFFGGNYSISETAVIGLTGGIYKTFFGTIFLVIALMLRQSSFVFKYKKWFSIIFGWLTISLIFNASHNYITLLIAVIVVPSLYWYYMSYGEVGSYMANRYVVFTFRRLLAIIPLFFGIALFTFVLSNQIGDPVAIMLGIQRYDNSAQKAALKEKFGLNDPLSVRFFKWIWGFIHGDMGLSFKTSNPVSEGFDAFLFETLKMQVVSLVISFSIAVLIGVAAAYYHNTVIDSAVSSIALLGLSMPIFVTGILAILIFGGRGLGWFPSSGAHSTSIFLPPDTPGELIDNELSDNWTSIGWWWFLFRTWIVFTTDSIEHLILPVLTLAFATMATFTRLTRGSMLEIMRQDYVLAARANGLSEKDVIWKHAFRNVLVPLITFLGLNIGAILGGAPITETVFTWPGLGRYFVRFLGFIDIPVMTAITSVIVIMILLSNLITDIVYTFVDPRVTI